MKGIVKKIPCRIAVYLVVFALCIAYPGMPVGTRMVKAVTSAGGEWEYFDNGNGTISVIRYNGMVNHLTIPETIDDKPLIRIGEMTFNCNTNLNSVIISNNVTDVGQYAFYDCSNLEEVMLPDSVVNIGQFAFGECHSLKSMMIPNSVTGIGASAFTGCTSLSRVVVSENITGIQENTFSGCTGLSDVILPNQLSRIEDGAFTLCSSLTNMILPDGVVYIGDYAFSSCNNLSSLEISKNVTFIGENAFSGCPNLVIYTTSGSYAETYASEHGIAVQLADVSVETPSPTPTVLPPSPTPTVSPSPTPTIPPSPTPTILPPSPTPTITPTVSPSPTPTITPTASPSPIPTIPPSPTPTVSPSPTPTITPTTSPAPPIPTPSVTPTQMPVITIPPVISTSTPSPTPDFSDDDYTGKKTQAIHAKSVTKEYGSKPFDLGANSDSYGELTYSSSNKKAVAVDADGWATVKGYGQSTITIKAPETNEYKKATKKITVTIVPKKVVVKTLKSPAVKKAVYSWKQDKTVNGYQIYVSPKKDFSSNTFSRTVKSAASLSLRGLKSKKTYYFKVRAYKLVGKKKYYGRWSTVKKVKIK